MKKRHIYLMILVTLLAAFIAIPARAGGWAVITVDALPARIAASETLTIGFTVRQHGIKPLSGLQPVLFFYGAGEKENFTVEAHADGEVGHYTALVTFPNSGMWDWSIQAFNMDQPMPPLAVNEASVAQPAQEPPAPASWALAGIGGLAGIAGSGWAFFLKRPRLALAFAILGLVIAGAGFAFRPVQAAPPVSASADEASNPSPAETGQALFVTKGCVTCHINYRINAAYYVFSTEIGPNLTSYTASAEYLRIWLNDPVAVKPDTKMPDLDLNEAEIEALIAFLNGEAKK